MRHIDFIKDWYVYESNSLALAGAASSTDQVNIEADADFYLIKLGFFADIALAVQTDSSRVLPLVTVQLTDTGSGRQLFNDDMPIPVVFGWGELPYILPIPRLFKANSLLRIDYTNLTAATTYNIRLAFSGWKDFGKVYSTRQQRTG